MRKNILSYQKKWPLAGIELLSYYWVLGVMDILLIYGVLDVSLLSYWQENHFSKVNIYLYRKISVTAIVEDNLIHREDKYLRHRITRFSSSIMPSLPNKIKTKIIPRLLLFSPIIISSSSKRSSEIQSKKKINSKISIKFNLICIILTIKFEL